MPGDDTFHSKIEKDRFTQSAILPDKRFHYRHLALDHAWAACALMDDDDRRRWLPPNPPGEAQPAITKQPPTQAQVWRARVKGHTWLLMEGGAGMAEVLSMGVWWWRNRWIKKQ